MLMILYLVYWWTSLLRFFKSYAQGIWDEFDGQTQILRWSSNQTSRRSDIYTSNKLCQELLRKFKLDEAKYMSTYMYPTTTSVGLDKESNLVNFILFFL